MHSNRNGRQMKEWVLQNVLYQRLDLAESRTTQVASWTLCLQSRLEITTFRAHEHSAPG